LRETLQGAGYNKWWAAVLSAIRILARFRRLELQIQRSGKAPLTRRTALLFVGSNAYGTTAGNLGKRQSLKQGKLWINVPTSSTRLGLLKSLSALVVRRDRPEEMLVFDALSLKVLSNKKLLTIASDGEVLRLKPPLNYHILPKALNVIVPVRGET